MSGKSNFADYEPLVNPKRSEAFEEDEFSVGRSKTFGDQTGPIENEAAEAVISAKVDPSQVFATPARTGQTALKAGHLVSFLGLFIFTFLVFFRPYEWSPSMTWLSKGALITAIATLLFFVPTQLGLENQLTIRPREVNLVLLLLLLGFLSVPLATDKLRAWNAFVDYIKVVIMFIVMVNVIRNESRLKALILLILVASCIVSIGGLNEYRAGNLAVEGKRITGIIGNLFENPNDLALHLVTVIPIVIALGLGSRNPFSKLLYFGTSFILLAGTVVTFSRAGFLGLICMFGVLAWRLMRGNKPIVFIGGALLVVLFLALAPGAYRSRLATTKDDSATARTDELKRSIYITIRHPLLGVGMNNFVVYSNSEHATHNAYTQVSSEVGVPAGVIYVLFLVAAFKRTRRMPHPREVDKRDRGLPYLAIGLQAALVGFMVSSFFASVAFVWYIYYLVAYIICIDRFWIASGKMPLQSPDQAPLEASKSLAGI